MKKLILTVSFFTAFNLIINAQILNPSFANWKLDTFYLAANSVGHLPADTETFYDPISWTTTNFLTNLDSIRGISFVTQSSNGYNGSGSAIQMISDSIHLPSNSLGISKATFPGLAVNGYFAGNDFNYSSTYITPMSFIGSGTPVSGRLASVKGYYNYTPVFNTPANSNDTCVVWAVLRQGQTVVANAIFKSTDSTNGYRAFSANFQYISCEIPDTLVIMLASSAPDLYYLLSLVPGSELLVDSLTYDTLPANTIFVPFAYNDVETDTTPVDTINVLANDTDCSSLPLIVSILSGPHHGQASVVNNEIVYTPDSGYNALDTIRYKDTNQSGDTADAMAIIYVNITTHAGINGVNETSLQLYPVPATNELNIHFQNSGQSQAHVYDMIGQLVLSSVLSANDNHISMQGLANGLYSLVIVNEQNVVVARSKFVVNR